MQLPYSDVVQLRRDFTLKHTHFLCSGDKRLLCAVLCTLFQKELYKCVSVHKTSCGGILLLVS